MNKSEKIKLYYQNKNRKRHEENRKKSYETFNRSKIAYQNCFERNRGFKGSYEEFKTQMEKHFEFMSYGWHNYGDWEVDHIIPLSKGGKHEVSNLQPLWKTENRVKYNKVSESELLSEGK